MQVYKAAKYIRLSYTDDKSNESNSVGNQRKLIEDFVSRHPEIELVSEKLGRGAELRVPENRHFVRGKLI